MKLLPETEGEKEDPAAGSSGGGGSAAAVGPAVQVENTWWPTGAFPLQKWVINRWVLLNIDSVLALRPGSAGAVIPLRMQSTNWNQRSPISVVHSVPELMVSAEQAEQLRRERGKRLLRYKKLILIVDLDQTLVHTTNKQHWHLMSKKDIIPHQLERGMSMYTRLRPDCKEFLKKMAKLYELHIFTLGNRQYAQTIAGFLDPEKKLFSDRIISRDECIDTSSKIETLRSRFPCDESMVCVIDDREDVWKFAPNLITVKRYIYFQRTGDINAPPGSHEAQMERKAGGPSGGSTQSTETGGTLGGEEQINGSPKKSRDPNISGMGETATSQSSQASANSSALSHESNNLDFDLSSDSDSDSITEKHQPSENESCHAKKSEQEECGDVARQGDSKSSNDGENTSAAKKPLGVLLPEPELGNGCSDWRESEMESQNNEQLGVTMGEELLDHSMEDEEEEEEEEDLDDHLLYLEVVLERIHAEYYTRYAAYLRGEASEMPDTRKIIPELKCKTLEGTRIVFSGVFSSSRPMDETREVYHAKALGATIGTSLSSKDSRTTHLIAARPDSKKVHQAKGFQHIHVVNPDWLWSCLERWERAEEQLFPLKDYSKTKRGHKCKFDEAEEEEDDGEKKEEAEESAGESSRDSKEDQHR